MSKTWFVTGAARGIGAAIVTAALNAGDRVVGTGRDVRKIQESFKSRSTASDQWRDLSVSTDENWANATALSRWR